MNAARPEPAERPDLPEGPRTAFSRFTMPADDWAREGAAQGPRTLDALREGMERYLVAVERFRHAPQAVDAVCMLGVHHGEAVEVETVTAADAFEWLCSHTYRKQYLDGLGQRPAHFRTVVALAGCVPILRVTRPAHRFPLDALVDRIEERLRRIVQRGASPEVARKGRALDHGLAKKRAGKSPG